MNSQCFESDIFNESVYFFHKIRQKWLVHKCSNNCTVNSSLGGGRLSVNDLKMQVLWTIFSDMTLEQNIVTQLVDLKQHEVV